MSAVRFTNTSLVNIKSKPNFPARRNIKIHVLRNGVASFKGICFPVKLANYADFLQLLTDLSAALKYKVFIHKGGITCLFTIEGEEVTSVDDLIDGQTYIATCLNERCKDTKYQVSSRPATTNGKMNGMQLGVFLRTFTPTMQGMMKSEYLLQESERKLDLPASTSTVSKKHARNLKLVLGKSIGVISSKSSKIVREASPRTGRFRSASQSVAAPKFAESSEARSQPLVGGISSKAGSNLRTASATCQSTVYMNRNNPLKPDDKIANNARSNASETSAKARADSRQVFHADSSRPLDKLVPASSTPCTKPADKIKERITKTTVLTNSIDGKKISRRVSVHSYSNKSPQRWITVLRYGNRPRTPYRILLNNRTPNFESVMNKINVAMKFTSKPSIFLETCLIVSRYEDFFNNRFIFFAFPTTSINWDDFDMNPQEEDEVERLNRISRLRKDLICENLPKCISSKYENIQRVSFGCFSVLAKCQEISTKTDYALKAIHNVPGNEVMEVNFTTRKQETALLTKLSNPNILRVFYQHETADSLYIVVDYLNGGDLHSLLSTSEIISESEALIFIDNIASALAYLHSLNIVHRDISASTLMIKDDGNGCRQLVVSDFSVAVYVTAEPLLDVVGFLLYMAPEMINRKGYGLEVDVWGAGNTLYYIITKTLPFLTDSVDESRRAIQKGIVLYEEPEWDAVSDSMKCLISALLERKQHRRCSAQNVLDFVLKMKQDKLENIINPNETSNETLTNNETKLQNLKENPSIVINRNVLLQEDKNKNSQSWVEKGFESKTSVNEELMLNDKASKHSIQRSNTSELDVQRSAGKGMTIESQSKLSSTGPGQPEKSCDTHSELKDISNFTIPKCQSKRSNIRPYVNTQRSATNPEIKKKTVDSKPILQSKRSDPQPKSNTKCNILKLQVRKKSSESTPKLQESREPKPKLQAKIGKTKSDVKCKSGDTKPELKRKMSEINSELKIKYGSIKPDLRSKSSHSQYSKSEIKIKRSNTKPEQRNSQRDTKEELRRKISHINSERNSKCSNSKTSLQNKCSDKKPQFRNSSTDAQLDITTQLNGVRKEGEGEENCTLQHEQHIYEEHLENVCRYSTPVELGKIRRYASLKEIKNVPTGATSEELENIPSEITTEEFDNNHSEPTSEELENIQSDAISEDLKSIFCDTTRKELENVSCDTSLETHESVLRNTFRGELESVLINKFRERNSTLCLTHSEIEDSKESETKLPKLLSKPSKAKAESLINSDSITSGLQSKCSNATELQVKQSDSTLDPVSSCSETSLGDTDIPDPDVSETESQKFIIKSSKAIAESLIESDSINSGCQSKCSNATELQVKQSDATPHPFSSCSETSLGNTDIPDPNVSVIKSPELLSKPSKAKAEILIKSDSITLGLQSKCSNATELRVKQSDATLYPVSSCSETSLGDTDIPDTDVSEETATIISPIEASNEYYSCPGYEREDLSETEIQAFTLDSEVERVQSIGLYQEYEYQHNRPENKDTNEEPVLFQGFGDEIAEEIMIKVGVDLHREVYASDMASETDEESYEESAGVKESRKGVEEDVEVVDEIVEEVRTRGFQLLQEFESNEQIHDRVDRYNESPYF